VVVAGRHPVNSYNTRLDDAGSRRSPLIISVAVFAQARESAILLRLIRRHLADIMGDPSMNFGEAIATCFRKYATFSGRAPRSEYWWFILFGFFVNIAASIADFAIMGVAPPGHSGGGPVRIVVSLALFLPNLAVSVRRFHDTNRSGFWLLGFYGVILAAGILMVVSFFLSGQPAAPNLPMVVASALIIFVMLIWWFVIMVLKGTTGENRFGPDPLIDPAATAAAL
jgi:uncharacterized membrane protein YhaH (DUF805 family)